MKELLKKFQIIGIPTKKLWISKGIRYNGKRVFFSMYLRKLGCGGKPQFLMTREQNYKVAIVDLSLCSFCVCVK